MSDPRTATASDARSPLAGCVILLVALGVMVLLVVFSTWMLFRQFDEIARFTSEEARPTPVVVLQGREAQVSELGSKLEAFRADLQDGKKPARLELGVDDINLAIAAYEPLAELRGTWQLESIAGDVMRIRISFPLNGKPRLARPDEPGWIASDKRYLNGVMVARPALLENELVLRIDNIEVEGAEVPEGFLGQMSPYRCTERYKTDQVLGPAMAALTRVEIHDGRLVLSHVPGEKVDGTYTDEEVDKGGGRLFKALGVAACIFLVFAGVMIFVGLRAKSGGNHA